MANISELSNQHILDPNFLMTKADAYYKFIAIDGRAYGSTWDSCFLESLQNHCTLLDPTALPGTTMEPCAILLCL